MNEVILLVMLVVVVVVLLVSSAIWAGLSKLFARWFFGVSVSFGLALVTVLLLTVLFTAISGALTYLGYLSQDGTDIIQQAVLTLVYIFVQSAVFSMFVLGDRGERLSTMQWVAVFAILTVLFVALFYGLFLAATIGLGLEIPQMN